MKKIISAFLALVLCLSLCSCGKNADDAGTANPIGSQSNSAVDNVIQMIDSLVEVNLSSGQKITSVEEAYAGLNDTQKSDVTNYEKLTKARAFYDRIFNVYTLIEQIGTVTKDSEAAIVAAEKAYQDLAMEERVAIINAATLTAARTAFDSIPTVVNLTTSNFRNYFTLEEVSTTEKKDIYGYYGRKIIGTVTVKPKVALESIENVTVTVRVNCSVGRPADGSIDAATVYETRTLDTKISVSASNGIGSGSFQTDGHYTSPHWYPSVEVSSLDIISVTGSVATK